MMVVETFQFGVSFMSQKFPYSFLMRTKIVMIQPQCHVGMLESRLRVECFAHLWHYYLLAAQPTKNLPLLFSGLVLELWLYFLNYFTIFFFFLKKAPDKYFSWVWTWPQTIVSFAFRHSSNSSVCIFNVFYMFIQDYSVLCVWS